jgi:hypothetical protein
MGQRTQTSGKCRAGRGDPLGFGGPSRIVTELLGPAAPTAVGATLRRLPSMNREELTQEEILRMLDLAESMRNIGVSRQRVLQVLEVTQHTLDCWARRYGALPIAADGWEGMRDRTPQARPKRRNVQRPRI